MYDDVCVVSTGGWEIENYRIESFERNDAAVHEREEDLFGDRMFPYVAIPDEVDDHRTSDLFYWAKSWSKAKHWWSNASADTYRVYQLRVKPWYMEHVSDELYALGGFFLSRKEVAG